MSLQGKKILLAITGSIAAYKTPQLVRLMVKAGAEVQVVMTSSAADFVAPLVLSTLSKHEVFSSVANGHHWNNHVALGRWADVMLVAPCSAHTLARMANGLCDNMVQAVYLSAPCPVLIAPAMDEDMWLHPTTVANVEKLKSYGHTILPVGYGELASGITGAGRMAEPEEIVAFLNTFTGKVKAVDVSNGKKALVTAGPTYEAIDPVRFIGNHSSGKMGIALAEVLAEKGYDVELVLGPVSQPVQHLPERIHVHHVTTAAEMYTACHEVFPGADVSFLSAAVADFRPEQVAHEKIKKGTDEQMHLTLVKNPDILTSLGKIKKEGQLLIGFALETENEIENAQRKLISKNADWIVLNSLNDKGAGFGYDTNKVTIIGRDGYMKKLELQPKSEIARNVVDCITEHKYSHA